MHSGLISPLWHPQQVAVCLVQTHPVIRNWRNLGENYAVCGQLGQLQSSCLNQISLHWFFNKWKIRTSKEHQNPPLPSGSCMGRRQMSNKHGEIWRYKQYDGCYETTGHSGHIDLEGWFWTVLREGRMIWTSKGQLASPKYLETFFIVTTINIEWVGDRDTVKQPLQQQQISYSK